MARLGVTLSCGGENWDSEDAEKMRGHNLLSQRVTARCHSLSQLDPLVATISQSRRSTNRRCLTHSQICNKPPCNGRGGTVGYGLGKQPLPHPPTVSPAPVTFNPPTSGETARRQQESPRPRPNRLARPYPSFIRNQQG